MLRRQFCRRASATGIAATSVIAGVSASGRTDGATAAVTTRGHFDVSGLGDVILVDGVDPTDYGVDGAIPGYTDDAHPDEIVVHVHGWNTDHEAALSNVRASTAALRNRGYPHPVVGFSWDSTPGYYLAKEIAQRNGAKLAAFAWRYKERRPGTRMRWIAHSMGARVVLQALYNLDEWGWDNRLTSLSLLGAAVENDRVSVESWYGETIEDRTWRTDNFWKDDDTVLNWGFGVTEFDAALGSHGATGVLPSTYTDHRVDYVEDHGSYYEPSGGCMGAVVDTW